MVSASRWRHFIEGKQICLRDVTSDDVTERYCAWLNDPEVNRYLETRFVPQTRDRVLAYVNAQSGASESVFLAIVRKADDLHVGNVRIGGVDRAHGTATVALVIGEKTVWGKGIGTEAIRLATRYAFQELGLRKLTARCYATNAGSIRAFDIPDESTFVVRPHAWTL